ncbi:hypothetical protein [Catellatospora sp. NPDC049133]|uniref:hypothetical protein n=1 Tax=Catellatospora sp. NPDC049133 TaxID=3155499 RepID=UPI0033D1B812
MPMTRTGGRPPVRRALTVIAAVTMALAGQMVGAGGAHAASSTAGVYTGIDSYPTRQLPTSCITTAQPGTVYLHDMVLAGAGGRHLGYTNCADDSTSYHRESRAWDWGMNAGNAFEAARVNEVLTWLLATDERGNPHANARRLGIGEIIWNRRIITLWSTTGNKNWVTYTGSNPHTDHVHFSMSWAGARKETSFFRSRGAVPVFALSDSLSASTATLAAFSYGFGAAEVIAGDWDGHLGDGIGLYDPTTWTFYLRNCPCAGGLADVVVRLGNFGDKPIAGDWDGDGRDDIGVYRPSNGTFYFHMLDGDAAPAPIAYGNAGDLPIIGDWNGDGRDDIGVYRPSNATFYKITGGAVPFGNAGDIPIVGDWTTDRIAEIGVYRPSTSTFYFLTESDTQQPVTRVRPYGDPGAIPVIGDWNGNGQDTQGVIMLG